MPKIIPIIIIVGLAFIIGGFVFLNNHTIVEEEQSEKPLLVEKEQSEKPLLNEITNWQIYQNEEFGFEIKYPDNWEFSEFQLDSPAPFVIFQPAPQDIDLDKLVNTKLEDIISILDIDSFSVSVHIYQNPNNLTVEQFAKEKIESRLRAAKILGENIYGGIFESQSTIDFNDYPAHKLIGVRVLDTKSDQIYITHEARVYMIEFPRTYLANEDSDFFLNFNFAKNIPIAEQILSTFQYMDGGENYISIIIEKGADADFYPPIRKLIGVKNDGSKIVLLNDIDQSLPISRYGAEKGITKTQDNLSQDSFIYSFAQNVQKVYIGRFVDGSEVYDYIHEYDLRLNKIRQINIPATYMSSHNHVRVKSPNGEKVALYGHDGVGVFDLTKNKIIFFLQSEDVDGIFLDADSLVSSPENYIDILFKWRSSTTLEYPIYEQGGNQYPELKTIKTVSF